NPSPLKTAELIQADMAQVGVKVKIIPVEGRFQEARLMDMNNTVEFRLTQPDASFMWHLATHYASVMSAEYAAKLAKQDRQE
ncbi:hypothetical protein, partial [Citrobacter braakii]|uniref:hypothetical protein n=1 Tax=Citrobacter braakii TaxID=57706 RepID=UPI00379949FB